MKKRKIPKCNGRPQLWTRTEVEGDVSIRIIYPNGVVHWALEHSSQCQYEPQEYDKRVTVEYALGCSHDYACTRGETQEESIRLVLDFDKKAEFLGYL